MGFAVVVVVLAFALWVHSSMRSLESIENRMVGLQLTLEKLGTVLERISDQIRPGPENT